MYLCQELWREIWSFDSTYKNQFDSVVREIKLRYDDGRWWIRQSGLFILKSEEYVELNFLDRDSDHYISLYYFKLKDVLRELVYNYCLYNIPNPEKFVVS